ncbi:hypothetical protein OSB04_007536 [Centaurea solstitialis]|uniref:DUF4283 domain-containing protein n=1 Tax=Centaurea solstitialis TaxID=347529 RepID=A0AA38TVK3_9ASTR|nr:hypothetical protein OSB04_007536 [Centaurea solstitialis]
MWNTFACVGAIVDLYIARKKTRGGRIRANLARFSRNDAIKRGGLSKGAATKPRGEQGDAPIRKVGENHKTFAEVVKGAVEDKHRVCVSSDSSGKCIKEVLLHSTQETVSALDSSLIGELKSLVALISIKELCSLEGWPEVRVCYIGGLSVQLVFNSKKAALDFLNEAGQVWKDWFTTLSEWSVECHPAKRLALLEIQGIPLHARNEDSLIRIGRLWGDVIKVDLDGEHRFNKSISHVHIRTEKDAWIVDSVEAMVEDRRFGVRAVERPWDGWELGEIISTDRDSSNGKYSDEASLWGGSVEEECNSNSSSERGDARHRSIPDSMTPAREASMSVVDEKSLKRVEEGEELLHKEGMRTNSARMGEIPIPRSGNSQMLAEVEGSQGARLSSPGPSPKIDLVTENKSTRSEPFDSVDDVHAMDSDSGDLPLSDEGEEWLPQSKLDGLEKRRKRSKKFRYLKSPCNCARRKRGRACKHSELEGTTVGNSFVVDRDPQSSLDYESMIKRLNNRISSRIGSEHNNSSLPAESSLDSPVLDAEKLTSVGKAIGLDLNNKEGVFKILVESGVDADLC